MAATIQARYAQAKKNAAARLDQADNIDVSQVFQNFQDASKSSIECNKLSMKLMDSFNILQNLHHEWESIIADMSDDEEEEPTKAEREQQKLDEEIKSEPGFQYFYIRLTQAQTKMQEALQNALTQQKQFFQNISDEKQEDTIDQDKDAHQDSNDKNDEQASKEKENSEKRNIHENIFGFNEDGQRTEPGSFNIVNPQPTPSSSIFGPTPKVFDPDPFRKNVTFGPTTTLANNFTTTVQPPITVNPVAPNYFPTTANPAASTLNFPPTTQSQSTFGIGQPQIFPTSATVIPQPQNFFNNVTQQAVQQQPTNFGFQNSTVIQQPPPSHNTFVPQMNTVGQNFVNQTQFVPQMNTVGQNFVNQNQFAGQTTTQVPVQQPSAINYQQPQHIPFTVPKIPPPTFNGDPAKFRNFWQIFSLIHNNQNYSAAEKLAYLLSCLTGTAKQAFEGYDICDINYQPVVNMLHQTYGQPNQILAAIYKQYDQVPVAHDSIAEISKTVNLMECYLRQLQALGVNIEDMGLQQTFMKKLPNSFLLKACSNGFPSTFQMLRHTVTIQMQLEMQFKTPAATKEKTHSSVNATAATEINVNENSVAPWKKGKQSQKIFSKNEQRNVPFSKNQKMNDNEERTEKKYPCCFCSKSDHHSYHCKKFESFNERMECLKRKGICECCLKKHDSAKRCFPLYCKKCCKKAHVTFLCPLKEDERKKQFRSETKERASTKAYAVQVEVNVSPAKEIAMPIIEANIHHPTKAKVEKVNLLLDSASASTFINEKLAQSLQLPVVKENIVLEISRFGDAEILHTESKVVIFQVQAEDGELINMDAYTIPTLTQALPKADIVNNSKVMVLPEVLIGNDHYGKIVLSEELESGFSKIPSKLGPIICGKGTFVHSLSTKVIANEEDKKSVERSHEEVPKFWDTENFLSDNWEEHELIQHFCKTAKIVDGRIQIELPFSKDPTTLPSNKIYAMKCLESLLKRLAPNPDNLKEYDTQINYLKENLMVEEIPEAEKYLKGHYLSHHSVITPGKTTPLRVVYNCSGKMSKNSPCLNDYLEAGPALMPKIVDVLIRYRMAKILVMGDVQKAFLQIRVDPQHRQFLRFFWIKNMHDYLQNGFQPQNVIAYHFCVVLFGCTISPFFMNIALMVLFDSMKDKNLGEQLKTHTYADNGGIKAENDKEAIYKTQATIDAFASVKMNFRGIMSNSDTVRKHFKVEPSIMSMLGLKWNPENDNLYVNLTAMKDQNKIITKRTVTAEIGRKYDPLGFVAPVVLRYKMFLQKLWTSNLEWDKPLPPEMAEKWEEMINEEINFEAPRFSGSPFKNSTTTIHGFVDASNGAYAAVIYLLHKDLDSDQFKIEFLICKTKVAPLTPLSIPRKELLAALLGAKLLKYILVILPQLSGCKLYLWTDASSVFYWLQTEKPLKTFVKNRVNMIKEVDLIVQHVPTKDNPADAASRGCSMEELKNNQLWKNGPSWLASDSWPSIITTTPKIDDPEIINEVVFAFKSTVTEPPELLYSAERASSWMKIIRVTGQCIKFGEICRKRAKPGPLSAAEILKAEKITVKLLQQKYPPTQHTAANLNLVMDEDGLIHMQSRIQHCNIDELANPLFLHDCPEVRLLILFEHQNILHGGPKATLTKIRQKYWIPKGLLVVNKSIANCRHCVRYKAKPYSLPLMPNLPTPRVMQHAPFEFCGIDAAGPWKIKGSEEKRWIVLITCLTTRAVYLDVLENMSAQCCINAIIRFMGTFNAPSKFLSDHGSNFKSASTFIKAWDKVVQDPDILDFTANHKIEWTFITERSPWKGGLYERLIGIMKNCLKFAIGRRKMNQDDFYTLVKQVQGIMNSRPIVDIDPEKSPLRPIDFLIPQAKLTVLDEPDEDKDPSYLPKPSTADKIRSNFKQINLCLNKYWERWVKEYLTQLRDTCATLHKQNGLNVRPEVDDIVLIEEEELVPRGTWRLGKIVQVKESSDGKVREAAVKVGNGNILNRSPSHLYPLEANLEPKKVTSNRKTFITPLFLTVLMLTLLPIISAYPIIENTICTADKMFINVTDVAKLVVRFSHRTKNFNVNSTYINISLPIELASTGGHVNLVAYSNEGIFVQQEILCHAPDDYCMMMDCHFCYHKLINYQCWHWMMWIILALIFLLINLLLCKWCKKSSKKSLFSAGAARLWNFYKRSKTPKEDEENELEEIQPRSFCLKCDGNPFYLQPNDVESSLKLDTEKEKEDEQLLEAKNNPLRKKDEGAAAQRAVKHLRRTSHLAIGIALILLAFIPYVEACTKSVVIQAGKDSCIINKDGWTKCQYSQQSFITAHSETEACLLFQNDIAPIATLTIQTFVQAKCVKTNHFQTALGNIDVQSYKHCPGVGLCFDQMCAEISPDSMVEELVKANKHIGVTSCVESCGSLTCYCPLPGTGCTFYRYFIEISESNLTVFSCPEWKPEINVNVKIQSSKQVKQETFNLYEGETFTFANISFHLTRLTLPFLDKFRGETYFIKNGSRLAWIDDDAQKEIDIVSCIGNKTCTLKPDICRCQAADSTVKCMCGSQRQLKRQWKENILPSMIGHYMVLPDKDLDPVVHLPAIYDMVIETTGFKAAEYIQNASGEIKQATLKGRIGPEGAILNLTCQSSFGQILGHVECSGQSFYAKCSSNETYVIHRWYSNKKVVNENCKLKCFSSSTSFQVYGILAYMEPDTSWTFIHGNGTNIGGGVLEAIIHAYQYIYDRVLLVIAGLGAVAIIVFILK